MNYAGHYINLDRNPERRAEIEAELARFGLRDAYARFRAADGNALGLPNPHLKDGEMGCFTSHYLLLKENLGSARPLHVIEDDVIFAPCTEEAVGRAIDTGTLDEYDILYTDIWIPLQNHAYQALKKMYDATVGRDAAGNISSLKTGVVNMRGQHYGSTSSYLIGGKSIRKLHDLYAAEIASKPSQSIDLFIRRMNDNGTIRVGCIFPFVTSVRLDHIVETNIDRPYHEMSALATHIARYSFFVGADFDKCRDYLDKFTPPPPDDKLAQILSHLLAYSLTDNFRSF